MLAFLGSEVAVFGTLIAVYLHFLGKDEAGPTPEVLSLGLVIGTTICLLSSSITVHQAEKAVRSGSRAGFLRWWSATILLGIVFLSGTAYEWNNLIREYDLTISRNLFGTTYYTLVGFHAVHVTVGVIIMLIVLALARGEGRGARGDGRDMSPEGPGASESQLHSPPTSRPSPVATQLVSWYWHFVDGVWVVVFTVVYVVGR
jgi:cytochrome c oxidase subunit 3/cytochrome o ubiquinol oxidase subunit 3